MIFIVCSTVNTIVPSGYERVSVGIAEVRVILLCVVGVS